MSSRVRGLLLLGAFFLILAPAAWGQEEMVANPYYKFWAKSKPGDTAVFHERTKLTGPAGKLVPDGLDDKKIVYKLVSVSPKHAVVEMVVTEKDFLGFVKAAPTQYLYPAKLKKSHLERIILADEGKPGEGTVKVGDKELKCKTVSGTVKGPGGSETEFKLWLSSAVPGTIVKHVRKTRHKGDMVAETTATLHSYKKGE
jgi:hypothetical protein